MQKLFELKKKYANIIRGNDPSLGDKQLSELAQKMEAGNDKENDK